jgi:hypothetical protein
MKSKYFLCDNPSPPPPTPENSPIYAIMCEVLVESDRSKVKNIIGGMGLACWKTRFADTLSV